MKEFTKNGITLVFYKKPNDEKFSFLIRGDEELTEKLLSSVSNKRIREDKIKYAVKAIFEKITNNSLIKIETMNNPIIELAERCQRKFRQPILTRVLGSEGACHNPTIYVEIELPNGKVFKGAGANQRIAKQEAALKALKNL